MTDQTPPDFTHVVLTRFNVRLAMYQHRASDDWLSGRLALFEQYCLPSFAAQTEPGFRWLVFFDSESPDWFRVRIAELAGSLFEPVYVEGPFDTAYVARAVADRVGTDYVITTRVDNDDAVAKTYIETIQQQFDFQQLEFVNLVNGAQLADQKLYLRPYTQNPFISLVERMPSPGLPRTVFVDRHYQLNKTGPIRNVRTPYPIWLQVVHGDNVLNEIVGLRARSTAVKRWYACPIETDDRLRGYGPDRARGGLRIGIRLLRKPTRILDLVKTVLARPARAGGSTHGS